MRGTLLAGMAALAVMVPMSHASAQSSRGVFAGYEQWSRNTGHLGAAQTSWGAILGLDVWNRHGSLGAQLGRVPRGDGAWGWTSMTLRAGPRAPIWEGFVLGGSLTLSGVHTDARKRQSSSGCSIEVGCFNETPPAPAQGWGLLLGGSLNAALELVPRLELMVDVRRTKIVSGANSGESLPSWNVGLRYVWRRL